VDRRWKHPNKDGGPDRRFRDNRLLPVCLYEVMHLSSTSGANELMEFSRTGLVPAFSAALHDLPHRQAPDSLNNIALLLSNPITPTQDNIAAAEPSTDKSSIRIILAGVAAAMIVGFAAVTGYALRATSRISTGAHEAAAFLRLPPSPKVKRWPRKPSRRNLPPRQSSLPHQACQW
jgi:hypothetical protein